MADNILDVIRDRIRQDMNDLADNMIGGNALSELEPGRIAVSYAKDVGVIQGLAMAERTILDALEDIEKREKLDV